MAVVATIAEKLSHAQKCHRRGVEFRPRLRARAGRCDETACARCVSRVRRACFACLFTRFEIPLLLLTEKRTLRRVLITVRACRVSIVKEQGGWGLPKGREAAIDTTDKRCVLVRVSLLITCCVFLLPVVLLVVLENWWWDRADERRAGGRGRARCST